jgi:ribosomal-protein-alanine N-acetyltransferase
MTALPPLETERLVVRPFVMSDLDAKQRLDLAVWGEVTLDEQRTFLQWADLNHQALAKMYQPPYGDRAIVLKSTGEMIGSVGIAPAWIPWGVLTSTQDAVAATDPANALCSPEMGLFWAVHPDYQGKGYATEAARIVVDTMFKRRLKRWVATTEYDNLASQAVMRKLGMTLERNQFAEPHWCQVIGVLENR